MELIRIDKRHTHTNCLTADDVLILREVRMFENGENIHPEYRRIMSEYIDNRGFKRYKNIFEGRLFVLYFGIKDCPTNWIFLVPRIFNEKNFEWYKKKIGQYYTCVYV